jgi:peroxiredoxin
MQTNPHQKELTIEGQPVLVGSLVIERYNALANAYEKIDSLHFSNDPVKSTFTINDSTAAIFRVRVRNSSISIPFVLDLEQVNLMIDFGRPSNYSFDAPTINASIKRVMRLNHPDSSLAFLDTVSNAAAFMLVYGHSTFENDLQKAILQKAIQKFPQHAGIAKLNQDFINYQTILQKEFNIGDIIPTVSLPDQNGAIYSTAALSGKPYMIFFWSTWCRQCNDFFSAIKEAKESGKASNIETVSIAMDKELNDWKMITAQQPFISKKLIDVEMWNGIAARTFYIDSIPYNFLVSANGRILAKCVAANQIQDTLLKYFPSKTRN